METQTLFVTAEPSNRKSGQVITWVAKQRALFEKDSRQPAVGESVPVMLTRPLYRRSRSGGYDFTAMTALLVREITDEYVLVHHNGFQVDPETGRTYAVVTDFDFPLSVTPGRTAVYVADPTVDPLAQPRPGVCYIRREDIHEGFARCEGLASWQDATYAAAMKTE